MEFLEDEFIYESDDSGDEWHDDNISSELENAFSKIVSSSSKPDIWKTEGMIKNKSFELSRDNF